MVSSVFAVGLIVMYILVESEDSFSCNGGFF